MKLPTPSPHAVFRRVRDGAVILSTSDEIYFGLNPVGAEIWELLASDLQEFEDLVEVLKLSYPDVSAETIGSDARELLASLARAGLLVPNEDIHAEGCA